MKTFSYVIDGLAFDKVGALYRCLQQVPEIHFYTYDIEGHILTVRSTGDQIESLEIAAEIVGFKVRGLVR
jgi:hypothetical protein